MDSIPKGYKNTDIGVIPEDWRTVLLGKKATLKARIGWQGLTTAEYKESGEYYLITGTEFTNGFINWAECNYIEKKRYDQDRHIQVKAKDVLVTKDGTIGKVAYVKGLMKPATLNSGVFVIRPTKNSFKPEYFYHILSSSIFRRFLAELSAGSTINHLYQKDFVKFVFQVPEDSAEQDSISTALSNIDSLITSLEKLVEKKKMIKQGVMQELLTGKRRLPGFSGEWKTKSIEDLEKEKLVKLFRGNVISKNDIANNPGAYPIYSSSIHNQGLFGKYGKYMFDEELITWSVDGGGDFFHRSKHKYSVTNVCGYMRLDTSVINYKFLALQLQLLHSRKNFDYQTKAHPSVIRKEYVLSIPTLEEQQYIAEFLQEEEREITLLENKLSKLKQIKQGAMQQLLTGKIRLINK